MVETYKRRGLDDIEHRKLLYWIEHGLSDSVYVRELSLISDEYGIDLTSLVRDYESTRSTLSIRYRRRDIAPLVADMDESTAKSRLIELVSVARKIARLSEVLMEIAVLRGGITRRATAAKGAQKKLASDPKQAAKVEAFNLWQEREAGGHPALRTEDQFAMEVCRRSPDLSSIGTVKKWSTQWRNDAKRIKKANLLAG